MSILLQRKKELETLLEEANLKYDYDLPEEYDELIKESFELSKIINSSRLGKKADNLLEYTQDSSRLNNLIRLTGEIPQQLLSEILSCPVTTPGVLWRGIKTEYLIKDTSNGIWSPEGIISTSMSKEVALEFAGGGRKGFSLIHVEAVGYSIKHLSALPQQEEVLLIKGKYHLTKIEDLPLGGELYKATPV